jgi:hypothetical protein
VAIRLAALAATAPRAHVLAPIHTARRGP